MTTPVVAKLKCLYSDCLHEWWPRTERIPQVCPRCKRYNWDCPHENLRPQGGKKHVKKVHSLRKKETAIDRFLQQHKSIQ